jgi:mannose-6-phosphate isomerase-like protein (cupin superfamily)
MVQPTRRVVTGHDAKGKAVVLIDGAAPNAKLRKASGLTSTLLWITDRSPADNSGSADAAEREIGVAPPPRGSIFRVVDFPPAADFGAVDNAAMLREMGIGTDRGIPRHAAMHRTKSIDYAVVISGEIDMLLDDSEVHLKAGDVLVQRGTSHAWENRGRENCRIAFVLIDGFAVTAAASPRPARTR